jgi:hypothetical protein
VILTAGLGFKLDHLDAALAAQAEGLWFEVHAVTETFGRVE